MTPSSRPTSISLLRNASTNAVKFAGDAWLQALVVTLPLALATVWNSVLAAQVYRADAKPFDLYILSLLVLVLVAIPVHAALLRRALNGTVGPAFGVRIGGDEGHLAIVALLLGILVFTVLGAAGLGLVAVIAGLDLAARAGADAPPIDSEVVDAVMPMLGEYFGTGEWIAAGVAIAVFSIFAIWFLSRLSLAYAATIARGKIQALSSFALTRGRWIAVAIILVAALLPGMALRYGLEAMVSASLGLPIAVEQLTRADGSIAGPAMPVLVALLVVVWLVTALTALLYTGATASLYAALSRDTAESVPA